MNSEAKAEGQKAYWNECKSSHSDSQQAWPRGALWLDQNELGEAELLAHVRGRPWAHVALRVLERGFLFL